MKKILLVISLFFLTGCFGDIGKGIVTKECSKLDLFNDISINTSYVIKAHDDNISSIKITEVYDSTDLSSIINSKISETNMYKNYDGITIDIVNNMVIYNIDLSNVDDFIIDRFNIDYKMHKVLNSLENNGFSCK